MVEALPWVPSLSETQAKGAWMVATTSGKSEAFIQKMGADEVMARLLCFIL